LLFLLLLLLVIIISYYYYLFLLLLLLLQERADIRDKENAQTLKYNGGSIQFENVHFRCV